MNEILKEMVRALIDYTTHNQKFTVERFKKAKYELRKNQRVKIEDLL